MQNGIILVTFADGSNDFIAAGKRLTKQAQLLNCFERIICMNSADLEYLVPEFSMFASQQDMALDRYFLYQNAKAYVLKAALSGKLGDFQQILYLDVGCEIVTNPISRHKLRRVLKRAKKLPIGVAQETIYREKNYTKRKVLEFFDCSEKLTHSFQVQPGVIILNNNIASLSLIELWVHYLDPKLGLIQDPESKESNLVAHRRDMSIFSILWKQNCGDVLNFYWNTPRTESKFLDAITSTYAIQAIRNRSGNSNISSSSFPKLIFLSIGVVALPLLKIRIFAKKRFSK